MYNENNIVKTEITFYEFSRQKVIRNTRIYVFRLTSFFFHFLCSSFNNEIISFIINQVLSRLVGIIEYNEIKMDTRVNSKIIYHRHGRSFGAHLVDGPRWH